MSYILIVKRFELYGFSAIQNKYYYYYKIIVSRIQLKYLSEINEE